jgi:hypothetical protein
MKIKSRDPIIRAHLQRIAPLLMLFEGIYCCVRWLVRKAIRRRA